jgi:hypothetical protein
MHLHVDNRAWAVVGSEEEAGLDRFIADTA